VLKFGALLLLAVFLAAAAPIPPMPSQKPPPAKTQAIGTEKPNRHTNRPEKATQPARLVVEAHVTGKLETTSNQTNLETQDEHSRWTDPITIFTGLLVIVGAFQVVFLRNTDQATSKAAKAAQTSADALLSQLRPIISVEGKALVKNGTQQPLAVFFEVRNSGQTPAFGVQVLAGVQFLPNPLPGPLPAATNSTPREASTFDIPRDKAHASRRTMLHAPTEEEWARLQSNTDALYLYGKVLYRDDFGNDGEVDFCQFLDKTEITSWLMVLAEDGKPIPLNFRIAPFNNGTRITRREAV
jgi:hypothetical protein